MPEQKRSPGPVPVIGSAGVVGYNMQATNDGPGIVIGRKGSIGSAIWVVCDFTPIDTTYFVVPIDGKVNLRWAYHLLAHGDLSRLNRATGVPGLNRDDVYSLNRSLPPLAEQRAIAAVLDAIDEAIERTEVAVAATERLRDALLHQLSHTASPAGTRRGRTCRASGPSPRARRWCAWGRCATHPNTALLHRPVPLT